MKLAVRFVVRRLCVPVNAVSAALATVGLPKGNQPWAVPSSKSKEIGGGAAWLSEKVSM
jgi:hypothetical protein